jgi:hypothetical protein
MHKGVTIDHQPKPSVTYYATRNRLLTLSTHRAPPAVWAHVINPNGADSYKLDNQTQMAKYAGT